MVVVAHECARRGGGRPCHRKNLRLFDGRCRRGRVGLWRPLRRFGGHLRVAHQPERRHARRVGATAFSERPADRKSDVLSLQSGAHADHLRVAVGRRFRPVYHSTAIALCACGGSRRKHAVEFWRSDARQQARTDSAFRRHIRAAARIFVDFGGGTGRKTQRTLCGRPFLYIAEISPTQ